MQWLGGIVWLIFTGCLAERTMHLELENVRDKVVDVLTVGWNVEFRTSIKVGFVASNWGTDFLVGFTQMFPMGIPLRFRNSSGENIPAIQVDYETEWQEGNTFQGHFVQSVDVVLGGVLVVLQKIDLE